MPFQKLILTLAISFFATGAVLAASPVSLTVDNAGVIGIDDWNARYLTGCWDSDEQAVFYYRDANGTITHAEICNEPDEMHHGLGTTATERAANYYDFLKAERTKIKVTQPQAKIVLGGLSGYNYDFATELLAKPEICKLVDVWNFHPYHLGVAPDEIDTQKGAWHTAAQWVGFYRQLLSDAGCSDMPIWATEFGYTTTDHNAEHGVSEAEQTDFALRQAVLLLSAGVERVSYFNGESYELNDTAVQRWNALADELAGSQFLKTNQSGADYCPRTTACFYDDSEYRAATGRTNWGIRDVTNQKKEQDLVFIRTDDYLHISWTRGADGTVVSNSPFTDISTHTRYADAIHELAERAVVSGYADDSFRSEGSINRAEFLQMVMGATSATIGTSSNCFTDVGSEWFAAAVCAAKARGWVHGYGDGSFQPANEITRAEAVKMIVEAHGVPLPTFIQEPENWHDPYFIAAEQVGILTSAETTEPGHLETRGHIAELVYRALNK